jgi:hypothetical protein
MLLFYTQKENTSIAAHLTKVRYHVILYSPKLSSVTKENKTTGLALKVLEDLILVNCADISCC